MKHSITALGFEDGGESGPWSPEPPDHLFFDFAVREARSGPTGDFALFAPAGRKVNFWLGDSLGSREKAAPIAAAFTSVLQRSGTPSRPADFVRALNRRYWRRLEREGFDPFEPPTLTGLMMALDPFRQELVNVSAGHLPPLIADRSGVRAAFQHQGR